VSTAALNRQHALTLVDTAISAGVQHAVLSPGSRNTPLVLALHARQQAGWPIVLHSVLDERAAGFFALGLARRTDRPVLLSCTSGSAGANYFPAVTEASEGQVPLLIVTADRPEELQDCGAPQTMAQDALFGAHVRFSATLSAPSEADTASVAGTVRAAIAAAVGAAPGPAHINTRFRKPLWEPSDPDGASLNPSPIVRLDRAPSEQDLDRLIAEVSNERGVIVLGPDPSGRLSSDTVTALATRLGWPVLSDPISTCRFGTEGPIVRHHDALLRSAHFRDTAQHTMAIALGGTPSSRPVQELLSRTPTIAINGSGRHWDPFHQVTWTLDADLAPVVAALSKRSINPAHPNWTAHWLHADALAAAAIQDCCADGLWEGSVAHHMVDVLPSGTLLRVASSTPIRDIDSFAVSCSRALTVSSNRGVNGIDGVIATTLGEAMVHSGPTALLAGDLSFLHDIGALASVSRPQQPVVVTVVDNAGGGIFGFLPIKDHQTAFEPWFVTPHTHDIPQICRGFGIDCIQPADLAEYREALQTALSKPGLSVIHVRIDRQSSTAAHHEAWTKISRHLEAAL